jgi:hypothetical protein
MYICAQCCVLRCDLIVFADMYTHMNAAASCSCCPGMCFAVCCARMCLLRLLLMIINIQLTGMCTALTLLLPAHRVS